jgi:1,4-alpha-glucan branching enzyme
MSSTSKKIVDAHPDWRPDAAAVEALLKGNHGDPFSVLGPHKCEAGVSVCVLAPSAEAVEVVDGEGGHVLASLERLHGGGVFGGVIAGADLPLDYRLQFRKGDAHWEVDDPYRYPAVLGELDVHLLAEGRHRRLYEKLGAHPLTIDGTDGVTFAVWAPNARRVSVVGEFNHWDGRRHPMRKRHEAGVWELFVPGVPYHAPYKYEIVGADGTLLPLKTSRRVAE